MDRPAQPVGSVSLDGDVGTGCRLARWAEPLPPGRHPAGVYPWASAAPDDSMPGDGLDGGLCRYCTSATGSALSVGLAITSSAIGRPYVRRLPWC